MFTILTFLQHFQRSASQELQWVSLKVTKFVTLADGEEVCINQSIVARLSRQANFYIAYATEKVIFLKTRWLRLDIVQTPKNEEKNT